MTVGIVGSVLEVEQSYIDQRAACLTAMLRRYTELHTGTGRTIRQRGVAYNPGIESLVLPAYARVSQYLQMREAIKAVYAANALLEPDQARLYLDNLVGGIPALAGAMNRRRSLMSARRATGQRAMETASTQEAGEVSTRA